MRLHTLCENCHYHIFDEGEHEIRVAQYCDFSGLYIKCQMCEWEEEFAIPQDPFERPAFFEMCHNLVNMHSFDKIFWDDNAGVQKLTLFQRLYGAWRVLRTRYIES